MNPDIIQRMQSGQPFDLRESAFEEVRAFISRSRSLVPLLNASTHPEDIRKQLSDITGEAIDASTFVFVPFHTNFGRLIRFGKNVFINHDCTFLDLGGITIEDDVQVGPKVCITSENHPLEAGGRRSLTGSPVLIRRNAWIGAGAIILPGVTIGENAVIAAGAVVRSDVPANTVYGGVPARLLKTLEP